MKNRIGLSMIEIMFALVIAALAMGPMLNLLSTTNKESASSIYEVMAAHYANEIGEQLLNFDLSPGYKRLCLYAGTDMDSLLSALNTDLEDKNAAIPRGIKIGGMEVYLMVTPLANVFRERKLILEELNTVSALALNGKYYKVVIRIGWNAPGEISMPGESRHYHESVVFLRKEI